LISFIYIAFLNLFIVIERFLSHKEINCNNWKV